MFKLFLDDKMYLTDDRVGEEIERLLDENSRYRAAIERGHGVLDTYEKLHKDKIIGMHWLWAVIDRYVAGDPIDEILLDYGYAPVSTSHDPFQCDTKHHVNMALTEWDKCRECGQRFEDMGF